MSEHDVIPGYTYERPPPVSPIWYGGWYARCLVQSYYANSGAVKPTLPIP